MQIKSRRRLSTPLRARQFTSAIEASTFEVDLGNNTKRRAGIQPTYRSTFEVDLGNNTKRRATYSRPTGGIKQA